MVIHDNDEIVLRCLIIFVLHIQVYSMAVERLLGVRPSRLLIESIEDGRVGDATTDLAHQRALEAVTQVGYVWREREWVSGGCI